MVQSASNDDVRNGSAYSDAATPVSPWAHSAETFLGRQVHAGRVEAVALEGNGVSTGPGADIDDRATAFDAHDLDVPAADLDTCRVRLGASGS